jgi:hypothetical protein
MLDYDSDLAPLKPEVLTYMQERLAGAGATFEFGQYRSEEQALPLLREADVAMVQTSRPLCSARTIPQMTRCRGLIRMGVG